MDRRPCILLCAVLILAPLWAPADASSHRITATSGGENEKALIFEAAEWNNTTGVTIPAGAEVISGDLFVMGMEGLADPPGYPASPGLAINGSWVWKFEGAGYGRLGRQQEFTMPPSNDTVFPGPSGPVVLGIRLPSCANVTGFGLDLEGTGIVSPRLDIGADGTFDWTRDGTFSNSTQVVDVGPAMNFFLRACATAAPDAWGNHMTVVPLAFSASSNGSLRVTNLTVWYEANMTVSNLAAALNSVIRSAPPGNVTIPLAFRSEGRGVLRVSNISIIYDHLPSSTLIVPSDGSVINATTAEFRWAGTDADDDALAYYFNLLDPGGNLTKVRLSNTSYAASGLLPGTYSWWVVPDDGLSNGTCLSGEFSFRVAFQGAQPLVSLLAPADGAALPAGPVPLHWTPVYPAAGDVSYSVYLDDTGGAALFATAFGAGNSSLVVSNLTDGKTYFWTVRPTVVAGNVSTKGYCTSGVWRFSVQQAPPAANRPPQITSQPPATARAGYEYMYQLEAKDPEGARLSYSLREHPSGMTIDISSGTLRWVPLYDQTGNSTVTVIVSDGNSTVDQGFIINVTIPASPAPPSLRISYPRDGQPVNRSVYIVGMATAAPGAPPVSMVQVRVGAGDWAPATLANGSWSYRLDTSTYRNGAYVLTARAYDGAKYSPLVSVNLTFDNPDYVLLNYPVSSDMPLWPYLTFVVSLAFLIPLVCYAMAKRKERAGPRV